MVPEMPIPLYHSDLPMTIYRKKQARNRSVCWTVDWRDPVVFGGGGLRRSLQFADSVFG